MRKERAGERGKSGIWPASMDNYEVCPALSPSLCISAAHCVCLCSKRCKCRRERSGAERKGERAARSRKKTADKREKG